MRPASRLISASSLLSLCFGLALPVPQIGSQSEVPMFVQGFPICNVSGWNLAPNNFDTFIYKQSGSNLQDCVGACAKNETCKSVAYVAPYTECLFYDRSVNETQLMFDPDSFFVHFDDVCDVCNYPHKM